MYKCYVAIKRKDMYSARGNGKGKSTDVWVQMACSKEKENTWLLEAEKLFWELILISYIYIDLSTWQTPL